MASAKFYGTGRRKKSIARVYLVPGTGNITINKRDIDEYLGLETLKLIVRQPLVATETVDKFDVLVNVRGADLCSIPGNGLKPGVRYWPFVRLSFPQRPPSPRTLFTEFTYHQIQQFPCTASA